MRKSRKVLIWSLSTVSLGLLFLFILYIYGFSISRPNYDSEYFTPKYLEKYSSPEIVFNHQVDALISNNIEHYQEVLGRKVSERELKYFKEHPYDGWKKPKIIRIEKNKYDAYIVTDNNWGEFFEKVNGRWVFTPENWGVNIRAFFRTLRF